VTGPSDSRVYAPCLAGYPGLLEFHTSMKCQWFHSVATCMSNRNSQVRLGLAVALAVLLLASAWGSQVQAGATTTAIKNVVRTVLGRGGREVTAEAVEAATKRVTQAAARHGDDVLPAVRKVGMQAIDLADDAGKHGPQAIKLMARYGDEAVWVVSKPNHLAIFVRYGDDAAQALVKHRTLAAELIEALQAPAARALAKVGDRNARRLAMMHKSGELVRIGRTDELLDVVGRYGDQAMEFIWNHKGKLASAALLAAFLADPEPYINGAAKLGAVVVAPVVEGSKSAAREIARSVNWPPFLLLAVGGIISLLILRARRNRRGTVSRVTNH
jgi:hypothetical protein